LFLFNGSVFYETAEGRLQVSPISWNKECVFRMGAAVWRDLIERHYPGQQWLALGREAFERLYAWKRQQGIVSWDETIEKLVPDQTPQVTRERGEEVIA